MEKSSTNTSANDRSLINVKLKKDGPYEMVLDIVDNQIVITGIFDGGIIARHGSIETGDQILSVNGISLKAEKFQEAVDLLEDLMEETYIKEIEFQLFRGDSKGRDFKGYTLKESTNSYDNDYYEEIDYDVVTSL